MLNHAVDAVRRFASPLDPSGPIDAVLAPLVDADLVLLGEASHGTHEFYARRADITKRLIEDFDFNVIAVEADWPDAYRVNRYVRLAGTDPTPRHALGDFHRYPRWMWRNQVIADFVGWLRTWNTGRAAARRVGWYGLDLYSLHRSMECVLEYLREVDPPAAARARERFACFASYGQNMESYGYSVHLGISPSCEREVIRLLLELRQRSADYVARQPTDAGEDFFAAEQNARVVRDAERYYRTMFASNERSWNLRDRHMMDTLSAVDSHVAERSGRARIVVWAHNSHLGDARATAMASRGELNLGQLARASYADRCRSLGFTTYAGTVTATGEWEEPAARLRVRDALDGSWEHLFHQARIEEFVLRLDEPEVASALSAPRLERAIGVIYRPHTERASHYFMAALPRQFDAVMHIDRTTALQPLETWARHEADLPETFPTGV